MDQFHLRSLHLHKWGAQAKKKGRKYFNDKKEEGNGKMHSSRLVIASARCRIMYGVSESDGNHTKFSTINEITSLVDADSKQQHSHIFLLKNLGDTLTKSYAFPIRVSPFLEDIFC